MHDRPEQSWRVGESELLVRYLAPTTLLYVFKGKMTPDFVPHVRAAAASAIKAGKQVDLFFDTEAMKGYHPEFRAQMTAWHEETREALRHSGVLVRSRVVQMAIAIANMATGGKMVSYSSRAAFDAAIYKVLAA